MKVNLGGVSILININISRHLKLEFASAIPDSNDEKLKQTLQHDKG